MNFELSSIETFIIEFEYSSRGSLEYSLPFPFEEIHCTSHLFEKFGNRNVILQLQISVATRSLGNPWFRCKNKNRNYKSIFMNVSEENYTDKCYRRWKVELL